MNENEKLFRAIGGVGEDLIAKADEPVTKTGDRMWYRIAALAACAALVIGVGALVLPKMKLGAKSAAPTEQEALMTDAAAAESAAAEQAPQERPIAEEAKAEEAPQRKAEEGTGAQAQKEQTPPPVAPKQEPPEEKDPEETPKEVEPEEDALEQADDTPDPEPLKNLDLFDQKYHFVSKSQSETRDAVFTDDARIGTWFTELFSGEQIYRYGDETVTGTDGRQYPLQCVVIYGRTAAVYAYSEEQAPPAQEEAPAEETPAE